jgi:fucose 4-O-acetylase-like acetyltransferase
VLIIAGFLCGRYYTAKKKRVNKTAGLGAVRADASFSEMLYFYAMESKTNTATNQRMDWIDYGKGIGIILVVYGHLLSSAYHAGIKVPEHFFALSDSILYGFHMPLFFLLSGLLVEGSLQKRGPQSYILDKFSRIAYPYVIWSLLQVSVEALFSKQTQLGATFADVAAIFYQPWGQFWFLYALFLMHITHAISSIFGKYSSGLLFVLAAVLFFNPLYIGTAGIYGFCVYFIFFVGGIILRKALILVDQYDLPLWIILSLFITLICSGYFIFEYQIDPVRLTGDIHPFYFLYLAVLGSAACIGLAQYLAKRNAAPYLKVLGAYSLQIYLVHMLAGVGIRIVLLHVFGLQNWVLHTIIGVGFALTVPILLQIISDKLKFPYLFEFKKEYGQASA